MSRTLFENSKAALAFAAMTIIGAVSMIGTSDGGGMLGATVDRFVQERENVVEDASKFAQSQSVGDPVRGNVSDPDAGWGSGKSVFGEFDKANTAKQPVTVAAAPSVEVPGNSVMTAPLAPGAVVVGAGEPDAPRGDPVITDREMTITPK